MTIAIAVTLPDGVLLVADGRICKPFTQEVHCSDKDKIEQISPIISAIPLGVTHATNAALANLRAGVTATPASSPENFLAALQSGVIIGWQNFLQLLAPEVDRNHHSMRAALVAGGIIAGVPFISGFLFGSHGQESSVIRTAPDPHFIVLGGEDQDAQGFFKRQAEIAFGTSAWAPNEGAENDLTKSLLSVAVETIRMVENADIGVGGTIRYQLIRNNYQPVKSTVTS